MAQFTAGPCCGVMLADMGADVIKIEGPPVGDGARVLGPLLAQNETESVHAYFMRYSRNKRSIALDLKNEAGKKVFLELVKASDIILENYRPGVMARMGLSYDALKVVNPRIIYASISGFGNLSLASEEYYSRGIYDPVAQAISGVSDVTGTPGGPPALIGASVGDIVPPLITLYGVMVALRDRDKSGVGQYVDVAMYDSMVFLNDKALNSYLLAGEGSERGRATQIAPWDIFPTQDGYVVITVINNKEWSSFCNVIGKPEWLEDACLKTPRGRYLKFDELKEPIREWLSTKTKKEAIQELISNGITASEVRSADEVVECEQLKARGMFVEVEHPIAGRVKLVGNPVKLSAIQTIPSNPPPLLGQHTDEILKQLLGYNETGIEDIRHAGAIWK